MARRVANPILDVKTRKQYPSKAAAGRDLAHLVNGDRRDNFVWYKLLRAMPDRFRVRNASNEWVRMDDPSAPVGSMSPRDDDTESSGKTRLTTIEIDQDKFAEVRAILGVTTLRDTVDRAFDEVLARAARTRSIERLQQMKGLDLDKRSVMEKAWR